MDAGLRVVQQTLHTVLFHCIFTSMSLGGNAHSKCDLLNKAVVIGTAAFESINYLMWLSVVTTEPPEGFYLHANSDVLSHGHARDETQDKVETLGFPQRHQAFLTHHCC